VLLPAASAQVHRRLEIRDGLDEDENADDGHEEVSIHLAAPGGGMNNAPVAAGAFSS